MAPTAEIPKSKNLALLYQEVLTAVVMLRASQQGVSDAAAFRQKIKAALQAASAEALAAGYTADDVKFATFAVVGFLDESVLNLRHAVFADWPREPLQQELFGNQLAGEIFYRNLDQILSRNDFPQTADLLEVHYLCLLLGFGGRYIGAPAERAHHMRIVAERIARIRGKLGELSPAWKLPGETVAARRDPWVRRLGLAAAICATLMVILFVVFKVVLNSGLRDAA